MASSQETLVQSLLQERYLKTPRIIDAFRTIDRADFVREEYRSEAYGNYPLPIGYGQTISQPLTVAFMLELLQPKPGEKILDIGAGSGWQTALLAHIAYPKGKVDAVEIISELCRFGEENIRKYNFIEKGIVKFYCQNAASELPRGRYDKIIAAAAAQGGIPPEWKKRLAQGGKIVAPAGGSIFLFIKHKDNSWEQKEYQGFVFVPLAQKHSL